MRIQEQEQVQEAPWQQNPHITLNIGKMEEKMETTVGVYMGI